MLVINEIEHYSMRLGGRRYAIRADLIEQVAAITNLHQVPNAPAYVKGLTVHNDEVFTLLDMHALTGLNEEQNQPESTSPIGSIGLLIRCEALFPITVFCEEISDFTDQEHVDWTVLEFPKALFNQSKHTNVQKPQLLYS